MTITITWWMIPTLITVLSVGYVLFVHKDTGSYFSGIGNIFMLIPALGISLLSWIVAAFMK